MMLIGIYNKAFNSRAAKLLMYSLLLVYLCAFSKIEVFSKRRFIESLELVGNKLNIHGLLMNRLNSYTMYSVKWYFLNIRLHRGGMSTNHSSFFFFRLLAPN